jgi:hypothetical protein
MIWVGGEREQSATAAARANTGVLHCVQDDDDLGVGEEQEQSATAAARANTGVLHWVQADDDFFWIEGWAMFPRRATMLEG